MTARRCAGCGSELPPNRARGRARKWCTDRCRKQTLYSTPCIECGAPTNGSDGRGAHSRCHKCNTIKTIQQIRTRSIAHRAEVEAAWASGLTGAEMATRFGWSTPRYVATLRARGYNLPYRRTAEQLARIRVGSAERMAKARAARRVVA